MTRSLLRNIEGINEDLRKDENKDKLLSQVDQRLRCLSKDIARCTLHLHGVEAAAVISGYVAKK